MVSTHYSSQIEIKHKFSGYILDEVKPNLKITFSLIRPMRAELFHEGRQNDRQTDMTKRSSTANAPNK